MKKKKEIRKRVWIKLDAINNIADMFTNYEKKDMESEREYYEDTLEALIPATLIYKYNHEKD